ncbi:T9SS type A sorting domain-containing protein [Cytophagaceae bacterium DM2B3-1]|uniref:T9SS type A sorting domain-containing protein n=1 Tax=Xanthocytophaga flava TaxID=3048013 RepID=A0ABT7CVP9_9BACT|nr:T9SS type A sorting domain-containing protein [Xanthocytophaga flavus]MDJ1497853.1 T9SS type A sorting domain-containing protein [Xanthocytophaga flavus]
MIKFLQNTFAKKSAKKFIFFFFFLYIIQLPACLQAQTPGLIVKAANATGQAVLDPNGDGYISANNAGFSANDLGESEIPFKPLAVPGTEPTSDLANGPNCGFTDFVDTPGIDPIGTYLSAANNLMFRFRLGGYAPNSKGYSILIDTDNKFGNTGPNADPNYVSGNPGFEVEIELVTNFGVRLYNADGLATPTLLTTLPYAQYAQKAIAITTNCSNPDYFYDFYIPFSVITTNIPSFTPSTSVRMVANTVISTQSALAGPISDIGGVDDNAYGGNAESIWSAVIQGAVPTSLSSIGSGGSFPPQRSVAPVVNGPIASGATAVSGTSTEANGTVITVYVNGVSVGTTTVTAGSWTLSGLSALASNASVTAAATASGKSISLQSSAVIVGSTCSSPPTISCQSNKGIGGNGPVGAPTGTTIRIYKSSGLFQTLTTDASNAFLYNCAGGTSNCTGGGPNCMNSEGYWITAQETGKCESVPVFVCVGSATATATPSISTTPITPSTASVSGTSAASAKVYLYSNGYQIGSTTATIAGTWTISGLTPVLGQSITAQAISTNQCISASSSSVTVTTGTATAAPVVKGPIAAGATSVSGTSTEAAGTVITVYKNGVSVGTTTVSATGTWTLTGLSPALVATNMLTATALASGKTVSPISNTVTVQANTTLIPTITGTYTEGGTSVSGTSGSPTGTIINVYIDGVLLGSTVVLAGGTWTLAGLSAANYDLYAGGILTATATELGKNEGPVSTGVTVNCQAPVDRTVTAITNQICSSTSAQIQITNSESGVIYTLRNGTNTANLSTSLLGTGGTITFNSFTFTSNQTILVQALKIPITSCTNTLSTSTAITVNPNPPTNNTVTFSPSVTPGSSATVSVGNTTNGFIYQLKKDDGTNANVGSPVTSTVNGSTVNLSTGALSSAASLFVNVTDATKSTNCSSRLSTNVYIALPVDLIEFTAQKTPQGNLLQWITASEKNNEYFQIERSPDGKVFQAIGKVEGTGTSQQLNHYNFLDSLPLAEVNYYRLKQVDFNHQYEHSRIVVVQNQTTPFVILSPNPCTDELKIQFYSSTQSKIRIKVQTIQGIVLKSQYFVTTVGSSTTQIPMKDIASGVYLIQIEDTTYQYTERVVKL